MSQNKAVKDIAELACLKLNDLEADGFQGHFDKILEYFNVLEKVDTSNIDPMITPHDENLSLREDKVSPDLSTEEVLQNAPDVKDSLFKVPPVV